MDKRQEMFEKCVNVPSDAIYNEKADTYCRKDRPRVVHLEADLAYEYFCSGWRARQGEIDKLYEEQLKSNITLGIQSK